MLDRVQWGEFEIDDIFYKIKTDKLPYKVSELSQKKTETYNLPVLTAGIENQGLNNYAPRFNTKVLKDVITISANGANTGATFFQNREFAVLQDAYAVDIKTDRKLTTNQYLFLTGCLSKAIYGHFDWTLKAGWERIRKYKISLPLKVTLMESEYHPIDDIDFDFMDVFVKKLESAKVEKLSSYLESTNLMDNKLSSDEEDAIRNFQSIKWGTVEIGELFDITSTKKIINANKINKIYENKISFSHPYIVRKEGENGVKGYIQDSEEYLNDSHTLSFGQDTFTVYYQKDKYFTGDKIKILKPKSQCTANTMIFLANSIKKSVSNQMWGDSGNVIRRRIYNLSATDSEIK